MLRARYKNSTIECPVGQLAVLWRHGRTRRYLCCFFTIDAITNAGRLTAWKIMARASAPCKFSDQHSLTPTVEPTELISQLAKPTENSIGMTGLGFAFSIPA